MKVEDMVAVRIYVTEASNLEKKIINYLQKEINIHGFSVFRAVSGSGETGVRKSSLMDLSLDLPLVIEFFDYANKVNEAIEQLSNTMQLRHIISWAVKVHSQ